MCITFPSSIIFHVARFDFSLALSLSSALLLMTWNVILTLKSMEDSGVDGVGVAALDVLVTLDWVDSSFLFSDTTLELIPAMATVDAAIVERLDSSGFFGLFFGIFTFFAVFGLLDVSFAAIASVSSFAFKKKPAKCE